MQPISMEEAEQLLCGPGVAQLPPRPGNIPEAVTGQMFFEVPPVSRRGRQFRGFDVWRQSGGIKGSICFPRDTPRIRRRYGMIWLNKHIKARFVSYMSIGQDAEPAESADSPRVKGHVPAAGSQAGVLYQILPSQDSQRWRKKAKKKRKGEEESQVHSKRPCMASSAVPMVLLAALMAAALAFFGSALTVVSDRAGSATTASTEHHPHPHPAANHSGGAELCPDGETAARNLKEAMQQLTNSCTRPKVNTCQDLKFPLGDIQTKLLGVVGMPPEANTWSCTEWLTGDFAFGPEVFEAQCRRDVATADGSCLANAAACEAFFLKYPDGIGARCPAMCGRCSETGRFTGTREMDMASVCTDTCEDALAAVLDRISPASIKVSVHDRCLAESFEDLTSPPGACGVVYTGIIAQHKNACSGGRPKVLQELLWGHKNQLDPGSRACFNADLADQPEAVAK